MAAQPKSTKILLEAGTNELEIVEFTVGIEHYAINVAKATFLALKSMMDLKTVAQRRGKKLSDFLLGDAAARVAASEGREAASPAEDEAEEAVVKE